MRPLGKYAAKRHLLAKLASSRLRSMVKLVEHRFPLKTQSDPQRTFFLELAGKRIGNVTTVPGGQVFGRLEIDPKYRGLGLGKKFLGEVTRAMPELHSGSLVGERGKWLYERAARTKGYRVTRRPSEQVNYGGDFSAGDLGTKSLRSPTSEPVFSVSLPAAAGKQPAQVYTAPKSWEDPDGYMKYLKSQGFLEKTSTTLLAKLAEPSLLSLTNVDRIVQARQQEIDDLVKKLNATLQRETPQAATPPKAPSAPSGGLRGFGSNVWGGKGRAFRGAEAAAGAAAKAAPTGQAWPHMASSGLARSAAETAEKATRGARFRLGGGVLGLIGGGLLVRQFLRGKASAGAGSGAMKFIRQNKVPLAVAGGTAGVIGATQAMKPKWDR
jgi:GNAT superfamily N-acetyltransferase